MTTSVDDAELPLVRRHWPHFDWEHVRLAHGAFHRVLVLEHQAVVRISTGSGHLDRFRRERQNLHIVNRLDFPFNVPRILGTSLQTRSFSALATTYLPGNAAQNEDWEAVREPLARVLHSFRQRDSQLCHGLEGPRQWCGGRSWPQIVASIVQSSTSKVILASRRVVNDVLAIERDVEPVFIHGDFGLHNLFFDGRSVSGIFDFDHAAVADPAIDLAGLVGRFGGRAVSDLCDQATLHRACVHRASLSLQVAAAAELAGNTQLRDHAVGNFARRLEQGTLYDPEGAVKI